MKGDRRGQATVELALALPVVVVVLLLVVQVALVVRAHVLVADAAREGARAAAVGEDDARIAAVARAVPGLDRARLRVEVDRAAGTTVAVTARYRVATDVPLIGPLVGDPVVRATVRMQVEDQAGG